jgi:hypothetical protein
MSRLTLAWRALNGELDRQFRALGIATAADVQRGWVIRTPGQGRGRRLWVREVKGPAGMHGLVQLQALLVELHGIRDPARLRELGANPEQLEEIYLDATALVVIEYLDWQAEEP